MKNHFTISCCKQCMVFSATDIVACMKMRSALTNDDVSRRHSLTAETFDTQSLRIRVASVTRTTTSLFMSHL